MQKEEDMPKEIRLISRVKRIVFNMDIYPYTIEFYNDRGGVIRTLPFKKLDEAKKAFNGIFKEYHGYLKSKQEGVKNEKVN